MKTLTLTLKNGNEKKNKDKLYYISIITNYLQIMRKGLKYISSCSMQHLCFSILHANLESKKKRKKFFFFFLEDSFRETITHVFWKLILECISWIMKCLLKKLFS